MLNKIFVSCLSILIIYSVCFSAEESNLPLSKQASFVESYSSSEVTIKATGLGKKDKDALIDLQKAAIYFVLYLGTTPILNNQVSKDKFDAIAESFFTPSNIMKYVSWEANKVLSTVKTRLSNKKKGYKITKMIRINKASIISCGM